MPAASWPTPDSLPEGGKGPRAPEDLVHQPKVVPIPAFGVVVFESRHAPGFARSQFCQEFSKFLLVIAGRARLQSGGMQHGLGPNSLVHVPARVEHCYEDLPNDPVTLYAIHYRAEALLPAHAEQLRNLRLIHRNLGGTSLPLARPVRSYFQEMLFEQIARRDGWEQVVLSCLGYLAVAVLRLSLRHTENEQRMYPQGSDSAARMVTYVERLHSGFYRQQTLDHAALTTGLSRRQFTDLFRKITGTSWHKYLERLRLDYARRLLEETENSVLAIAFESGFENVSSFHRAFKKAFQRSPKSLRDRGSTPAS